VTLGIGGNDIGFSSVIESCATLSPFGSPCRNRYVVGGVDQLAQRIQQTAPAIAATIQGVHGRHQRPYLTQDATKPAAGLVAGPTRTRQEFSRGVSPGPG
jgi:hypothetical protein